MWHGRAWFYLGSVCLGVEWHLRSWSCHLSLSVGGHETDFSGSAAVPPVALYWHITGLLPRRWRLYGQREMKIAVHHGTAWLHVWRDPWGGWSRSDRWWQYRQWSVNFADLLFGRLRCARTVVEEGEAIVPMPEAVYPATYTVEDFVWTRCRWPGAWCRRRDYWLNLGAGIPVPGKGENSWDCDENAIGGIGGRTLEHAVSRAVESALESRRRYGGRDWAPKATQTLPPTVQ